MVSKFLYGASLITIAIGLVGANALITIGSFGLLAAALISGELKAGWANLKSNPLPWILASLVILTIIQGLNTDATDLWLRDVRVKLSLLLIPIAVALYPNVPEKFRLAGIWAFIISLIFVQVGSTFEMLTRIEEYQTLVYHSKPVRIIGGRNHLYFSVLGAVGFWCTLWIASGRTLSGKKWEKHLAMLCAAIIFICMHFLVARTGLVALYASGFVAILLFGLKMKKYKLLAVGLAAIILFPIISYVAIPTMKERVDNTIKDFKLTIAVAGDPTTFSGGSRVEAAKVAWIVFKKNPILGVGMGDLDEEMNTAYGEKRSKVMEGKRLKPHNQLIQQLAGNGLIGTLLLLAAFLVIFIPKSKVKSVPILVIFSLFMVSMTFESMLERQVGVCIFTLAWSFSGYFSKSGT